MSDRMRKRRAFADKELETIMLEREYKERELLETSQAATASLLFPNSMIHHAAEYNSYKTAYSSSTQMDPQPKDLCNFLGPNCLDLSMQYAGSGNVELISSNVSVATTYRQYPLPSRGGFMVWPRGAAANLSDALLYQQCLLNATAVQNMKPGSVWEPKMMPTAASESHPLEQNTVAAKQEGSRAAALPDLSDLQQGDPHAAVTQGGHRERSAFSSPKRGFGQAFPNTRHPHTPNHEHVLNKLSKDSAKHTLSMKLNSFHSLIQQTLSEKAGAGAGAGTGVGAGAGAELRGPYCKEVLEEAARKYRDGPVKDIHGFKGMDRYGKDLLSKPVGTNVTSSESLSFSVEAILKRPSPLSRASQ